ncbi:hypothetical protein NDU88_000992 [Pleurodeles waltl]|uniref:Uncharacterized protein n=1 Tax=Pleurodeles waltl TaxID=8319 RepID=A0AAV7V9Z4_PLEWA|nr:hypothetical protein NDU88_000992 [Pleurodeles waltl]
MKIGARGGWSTGPPDFKMAGAPGPAGLERSLAWSGRNHFGPSLAGGGAPCCRSGSSDAQHNIRHWRLHREGGTSTEERLVKLWALGWRAGRLRLVVGRDSSIWRIPAETDGDSGPKPPITPQPQDGQNRKEKRHDGRLRRAAELPCILPCHGAADWRR